MSDECFEPGFETCPPEWRAYLCPQILLFTSSTQFANLLHTAHASTRHYDYGGAFIVKSIPVTAMFNPLKPSSNYM